MIARALAQMEVMVLGLSHGTFGLVNRYSDYAFANGIIATKQQKINFSGDS